MTRQNFALLLKTVALKGNLDPYKDYSSSAFGGASFNDRDRIFVGAQATSLSRSYSTLPIEPEVQLTGDA